jgi:hypothetical protein
VRCDAGLMKNQPEMVPGNGDGSGGDYQEILADNKKLGDSCRAHSGALVDHMDAISVAKDVDALPGAGDGVGQRGRSPQEQATVPHHR